MDRRASDHRRRREQIRRRQLAAILSGKAASADAILLETADTLLLETGSDVELNTSIPAQAEASTLDGTEWSVIVQSGTTKKIRTSLLVSYFNG